VGLAASIIVGAAPVPDNVTLVGEFVALLATLNAPLAAPIAVGANFTVYCTLNVGARTAGYNGWLTMLKPVPVADAELIAPGWLPIFVIVTVSVLLWFTTTLPKARLPGLAETTIVSGSPIRGSSYAPIENVERNTPSKSVANPGIVTPAPIAGLPGSK
jgi:hypothetical protein